MSKRPITINGDTVERVSSFKFLGTHITEDLTWTMHTQKTPLLPQAIEEVRHEPTHPQDLLQLRY